MAKRARSYRNARRLVIRSKLGRGEPVRCCWCEKALMLDTATLEHKVPLSKGGLDQMDNWDLACKPCNDVRGNSLGAPNRAAVHQRGILEQKRLFYTKCT